MKHFNREDDPRRASAVKNVRRCVLSPNEALWVQGAKAEARMMGYKNASHWSSLVVESAATMYWGTRTFLPFIIIWLMKHFDNGAMYGDILLLNYAYDDTTHNSRLRKCRKQPNKTADNVRVKLFQMYLEIIFVYRQAHGGVPFGRYHVMVMPIVIPIRALLNSNAETLIAAINAELDAIPFWHHLRTRFKLNIELST